VVTKLERSDPAVPYQVRVLDRAIDILDALTVRRTDMSIREIVDATGLNRSTAIRLAANLERRGLLQQDPVTSRFRLGHRLFQMGSVVYSSLSLLQAASGPLSALEQQVGATIVLAVREGEYTVTVDKRQGVGDDSAMVPMPGDVGEVRPITYGPVGQVFLSMLKAEEAEALLDRYPLEQYTPYSTLNRKRYMARLPKVHSEGYAIEVNEVVEGLMGIAAPIFDFTGSTVGVISLGFPATRETDVVFVDEAIGNQPDLSQSGSLRPRQELRRIWRGRSRRPDRRLTVLRAGGAVEPPNRRYDPREHAGK
jgi:IclR family KDG regulon transcriptional repressor